MNTMAKVVAHPNKIATSEDPSPQPLALPEGSHLAPPRAEDVARGESEEQGGDGGCTAVALVEIGVWPSKEEATAALDAQIKPMHEELQR